MNLPPLKLKTKDPVNSFLAALALIKSLDLGEIRTKLEKEKEDVEGKLKALRLLEEVLNEN